MKRRSTLDREGSFHERSRIAARKRVKRRGLVSGLSVDAKGTNHWFLLLLSGLSFLLIPVVVAIITSRTTQPNTDKDYVSLAVNILSSKTSTPENRKWALKLLGKLSPVPFLAESEEQLTGGSGLTIGHLCGPERPFVKKDEELAYPCMPVMAPKKKVWTDQQMGEYITEISKEYADCANKQRWALAMIDILQNTHGTSAAIARQPKELGIYRTFNFK